MTPIEGDELLKTLAELVTAQEQLLTRSRAALQRFFNPSNAKRSPIATDEEIDEALRTRRVRTAITPKAERPAWQLAPPRQDIPAGECQCGCGAPVRGRFVHGHNNRLRRGESHPNWRGGRDVRETT